MPPFGPSLISVCPGGGATASLTEQSASIGPGSAANFFSIAAGANADFDFGLDTTFGFLIEVVSYPAATQTFCGYNRNGRGWRLRCNSTGSLAIGFLPATVIEFRTRVRKGLVAVFVNRSALGVMRASFCGKAAAQVAAAPVYVDGDATTEHIILAASTGVAAGRDPLAGGTVLGYCKFSSALTDAELEEMASVCNRLAPDTRYRFSDSVAAHPDILWSLEIERDYSGGASMTAGAGSAPPTWTKSGAVPKNVIAPEVYRPFNIGEWNNNVFDLTLTSEDAVEYQAGNVFRNVEFETDAERLSLYTMGDFDGDPTINSVGLSVDGVNQLNASSSGTAIGGIGFQGINGNFEQLDQYMAAGNKTLVATNGWKGRINISAVFRQNAIQGVQMPQTASYSVTAPSAPVNRFHIIGASSALGNTPGAGGVTYAGMAMLVRSDYPGEVSCDGGGGDSGWLDYALNQALIDETTDYTAEIMNATGSNRVFPQLGNADWDNWGQWGGTVADLVGFEAQVGLWCDTLEAKVPGAKIHIQTGLFRTAAEEATLSPLVTGVTLQQVRDALTNVVAARPGFCFIYDGTTALLQPPSADFSGDNVHPSATGQAKWKLQVKTWMAAATDSVGGGY